MINNKKIEMTAEKLSYMITLDNVTQQVEDGWTNSHMIVQNVVGLDAWRYLQEWDRKILAASVHKIVVGNDYLRKRYFE